MSLAAEYMGNPGDGFRLEAAQRSALADLEARESEHLASAILYGAVDVVRPGVAEAVLVESQRGSGETCFWVIRVDGAVVPAPDALLGVVPT